MTDERVPWSVAMGFESLEDYESREDDHPGDDDPSIAGYWG